LEPLIIQTRKIDVTCDFQPEKLDPLRVQAGKIFAISIAAIIWVLAGLTGIINLLPLWSSILGLLIAFLAIANFSKIRGEIRGI
jgi:hypothetical protein